MIKLIILMKSKLPWHNACNILYIANKYYLLRVCKTPPAYDESLQAIFIRVLPVAFFIHLAMAAYMLGEKHSLRSELITKSWSVAEETYEETSTTEEESKEVNKKVVDAIVKVIREAGSATSKPKTAIPSAEDRAAAAMALL